MKINKFPNSKILYSNCDINNEELVDYYKKCIKNGLESAKVSCFIPGETDTFVEPIVLFCKDKKLILSLLPSGEHEVFRLDGFYEDTDMVAEETETQYGIHNVKMEYIGALQTSGSPVFYCNSWNGEFEHETVEIPLDELDSIDVGPMLSYLLDFRGYNYHVWAKLLYHAGCLE